MTMIVNPKGLFDPYYVPTRLLYRDQELGFLEQTYYEGFEDQYGITVLVKGMSGIGRTVLSRYFITRVIPEKFDAATIYVDAAYKSELEIVSSLNEKLSRIANEPFTITFDLASLWTNFQHKMNLIGSGTVLVIDNLSTNSERLYQKIARLSKELNTTTIGILSSFDYRALVRGNARKISSDFELSLENYTQSQLIDILKARVSETFPTPLRPEIISYITDIVFEFDVGKPATSIDALKSLWPMTQKGLEITAEAIRKATTSVIGTDWDESLFDIVEFLSVSDFTTILVLDVICEYFINNPHEPYISYDQIHDLSIVKFEEMGLEYSTPVVNKAIQILLVQSILFESNAEENMYYIVAAPEFIKDNIDSIKEDIYSKM